tara:strand:+ start:519 stop:1025 length:507 start_codon:yes stop_codon:yes gene_type:complete
MAQFFNISGELTQQLLVPNNKTKVNKILLTNVQKIAECKVDLYIEKPLAGKFYLLKAVELPKGTTLVYDDIYYDNSFGLYIKLTDGATFTLTGSIDVTGTNVNVPGTNTLFTSELSIGDEVVISGETRTITTITSDTAATVTAAFGSDLSNDTSPDCNPTALVDVIIN